jgi:hypothetical protein
MSIHGIDGRNDGSYLAAWMAQSDAQQRKNQEAYLRSPQGLKKQADMQNEKLHKQNAAKAYASGGDQALADFYLNADPKVANRNETNAAKNVKAGKTTFKKEAQNEIDNYNAYQNSVATPAQKAGPLQNTFQFAIDNPYEGGNNTPSKPTPAATPSGITEAQVSTKPVEETTGKFPWQKAKEKAQSFQELSDKVNSWKEGNDPYKTSFNKSNYKFDSSFTPWGQDK